MRLDGGVARCVRCCQRPELWAVAWAALRCCLRGVVPGEWEWGLKALLEEIRVEAAARGLRASLDERVATARGLLALAVVPVMGPSRREQWIVPQGEARGSSRVPRRYRKDEAPI